MAFLSFGLIILCCLLQGSGTWLRKRSEACSEVSYGEIDTIITKNEIRQFLVPKQSFGLEMSSNAFDNKNMK